MANVSYQGPLPLPSAHYGSSLTWATVPRAVKAPLFLAGGGGGSGGTVFILDTELPSGELGVFYSQALSGGGGSSPYTFALSTGSSLPTGLSLSSSGVISGTPTTSTGTAAFTVVATDNLGATGNQQFSLTIEAASGGDGNSGYVF